MSDLLVRAYEPDDRSGVLELLGRVFPGKVSEAAFRWRFEANPLGAPLRTVAVHDGVIVGFNSWLPWPIELAGQPLSALQSGESAVDPAMRGRGIFGKLIGLGAEIARAQGANLFLGFPNQNSLGAFQRAGWTLVTTLEWWVRPTPLALLGIPNSVGTPAAWRPPDRAIFRTRFDLAFLSWRFAQNPYHRHDVDEVGDARVFSRSRRRGPLRERLVILGIDGHGEFLDPADAMRVAASRSPFTAFVSSAVSPDTAARHNLRGRGYHRVRGKGVYFITLALNSVAPQLVANPDAWSPTLADVDIE